MRRGIFRSHWLTRLSCQVRLAGPRRARMWHGWALNTIFVLLIEKCNITLIVSRMPSGIPSDGSHMPGLDAAVLQFYGQGEV